MSTLSRLECERAMAALPTVHAVMTAGFDGKRSGVLVHRVMRASDEPVSVAVSVPKGHRITTLIRDSRMFALCLIASTDRRLVRKFEMSDEPLLPVSGDPFELLPVRKLVTGAPVLAGCHAALDCEVMRHFDLEADHEVYVGLVHAAWVPEGSPLASMPVCERVSGVLRNGNGNGSHAGESGGKARGRRAAVSAPEPAEDGDVAVHDYDDDADDGPM